MLFIVSNWELPASWDLSLTPPADYKVFAWSEQKLSNMQIISAEIGNYNGSIRYYESLDELDLAGLV